MSNEVEIAPGIFAKPVPDEKFIKSTVNFGKYKGMTVESARNKVIAEFDGCIDDGLYPIDMDIVLPSEIKFYKNSKECQHPSGGYFEPITKKFIGIWTIEDEE